MYLLDELNAYSHDLDAAVALVPLQRRDRVVDHRDGLAAVMTFVMRYVDTAKKTQPATWQGLQHAEPKKAIQALWSQAENTLASSCGLPAFGLRDRDYIAYLCEKKNASALADLLDRAPMCPRIAWRRRRPRRRRPTHRDKVGSTPPRDGRQIRLFLRKNSP